jgi:hypothetical protein
MDRKLHVDTLILVPMFKIYVFPYSRLMDERTDGLMDREINPVWAASPPSAHFGLIWQTNIECSLPAANQQNTSRVNLFRFTYKEMTPMTMSTMVAIRSIWLLW